MVNNNDNNNKGWAYKMEGKASTHWILQEGRKMREVHTQHHRTGRQVLRNFGKISF